MGWRDLTLKGEKVLKKAGVLVGVLLLCSGMILAGESEKVGNNIEKEFHIFTDRGEEGGFLGVLLRDVKAADVKELGLPGEKGVFLVDVTKDSPAEEAGLIKGDVIVEYQSIPVLSVKQFQRMVGDTPPGRKAGIKLFREKKEMKLTAEIGSTDQAHRMVRRFNLPAPEPDNKNGYFFFAPGMADGWHENMPEFVGNMIGRGPELGIEGAAMTEQMADYMGIEEAEGVLVTGVAKGSAAEAAGLRAGDLITGVNGKKVVDPRDLRKSLKKGKLELSLVRDRKKMSLEVDIAAPESKKSGRETLRM